MKYRWEIAADRANPVKTEISPPLLGVIAANRGITTTAQYQSFIEPTLRQLHDPFLLENAEKAARRIVAAIKAKEKIFVYGDYDVDGITGTVTLLLAIKAFGGNVDFYVPHRITEGYGLHDESIKQLIEKDEAKLIVSVDCGITGVGPAKVAKDLGVDLIITDHHQPKAELPDCYCIVHPLLSPNYPNKGLCGSGVAYKVAWAVAKIMGDGQRVPEDMRPFFAHALAFTALGTIADVVPLVGENRAIAQYGMKIIPQSCFPGLNAFVASARLDNEEIDGYKIGFTLAPRLNAAGRMGHASQAARMLLSDDFAKALHIGEQLEKANEDRQKKERQMAKEAEAQYQKLIAAGEEPTDVIIVVDDYPPSVGPSWHKGVMGIVASRLSEKHYKPSIVFVGDGGSGRSVEGFSLIDAVKSCEDLLEHFGGHEAACGLHVKHKMLPEFRRRICEYARAHQTPEMKSPAIKIECEAQLAELTESLGQQIVKCGPYGNGNRRPFFVFRSCKIMETRRMGKESQFLSIIVAQNEVAVKCVSFKPAAEWFELKPGQLVDVVGEIALNEWKGQTSVQIMLRDLELSDDERRATSDTSSPTIF